MDKPYDKKGKKYFPKKRNVLVSDNVVTGNRWKVWRDDDNKYWVEYNQGSILDDFIVREISKRDFELMKNLDLDIKDLVRNL
tara:strand:- start:297 stop:542 length:246 start_codon:yes stop_codon:yes gene_type:complete